MISISPVSGYRNVTVFTFTSDNPSTPITNWGDGTITYTSTATHTYSSLGSYNAFGGSTSEASAFNIQIFDGAYFSNKITIERSAISSIVSCPFTFTVNVSADTPTSTIILYSSGSDSLPYSDTRYFWSHLTPEWEFRYGRDTVSEFTISGTPVYSGTNVIGYSATADVEYVDDMPGNPALIFTLKQTEEDIPINSRAYAAVTHSICAVVPDKLFITADGINPINPIQWANLDIPYVISVGSSQNSCTNILHYLSGYMVDSRINVGCYYVPYSSASTTLCAINLVDDNCFPTGGYSINNLFIPASSLPPLTITTNLDSCDPDYNKIEYIKTRLTPANITLTATGVVSYNGIEYTVTGTSNPFDVVNFENRHEFFRKGEDTTIYDLLKTALPFDIEQYPNLNTFLYAVAGPGDTLGKAYDKIKNIPNDISDIDYCEIDSLIDKSKMLDDEIEDFGLSMPEELDRLFNFATIPLQKLIGTRCVCNTNFVNCAGCKSSNICTICKFDKRSNLGDQLTMQDYITAGDTILYKRHGGDLFNFLTVPNQGASVYKLNTLSSEPFDTDGLVNYCFFKWDSRPQNNPVEGVVNYLDSRNMLNPNLSSSEDWYGDNGIIEEMFNFVLSKNLLSDDI